MFDQNLKRIRQQNGLTQKDVADFLHISPQSISKWENGEATPSIEFLPLLSQLFNCKIDDFFASHKSVPIELDHLQKLAEFCRIFELEKDDPEYIPPDEYMRENTGWENSCIAFFKSMEKEKCFTVQTLQNYQKCDFETAQAICKTLEDIGCLTKAPDSKYYVTNAENMGGFIFMVRAAKVFANLKEFKNKTSEEFDAWLENEL